MIGSADILSIVICRVCFLPIAILLSLVAVQGVPKNMESNFKVRLFKDDLIVYRDYILFSSFSISLSKDISFNNF